jgi:hypothetical protein
VLHRLRAAIALAENLGEEEPCGTGPHIGLEGDMEAAAVVAGGGPAAGESLAVLGLHIAQTDALPITRCMIMISNNTAVRTTRRKMHKNWRTCISFIVVDRCKPGALVRLAVIEVGVVLIPRRH